MKHIIRICSLLFMSILLLNCDPDSSGAYKVKNATDEELAIHFCLSQEAKKNEYFGDVDSLYMIKPNEAVLIHAESEMGGTSIKLHPYDSIYISRDKVPLKVYKPDWEGKNIYNISYWDESKEGKRNYEYVFIISDNDIVE